MTTVLAILGHTPLWVWAVFAFVLFLGWQRARDRAVDLWRILLFPAVMIVLAISGMVGAGLSIVPAVSVGLMIGGVAGWLLERDGATRRLPDGRVWLRGEWWSLLQVVAIFLFRYVSSVAAALDPTLPGNLGFHLGTALVSSLLSAMILGRTLARLRVYFAQRRPAAA